LPARLAEKVVGAIPRFVHPKTKLFAVKFIRSLEIFALLALQKRSGCIFLIYASKSEVVCCEIQAHFGSSRFARFMKRIRVHYHD